MNVSTIPINVVLERPQSREVVRGLLHAVLFHRLFGSIKPTSVEVLDVTFPATADPEIEAMINTKVESFWRALDSIPGGSAVNKKGQLVVVFSEKRQKTRWLTFTTAEEEVPWEQWILTIEILATIPQSGQYAFRPVSFRPPPPLTPLNDVLLHILQYVSSVKARETVPPIVTGNVISPFPLRIEVRIGDQMIA